jgi:hypothetical protein
MARTLLDYCISEQAKPTVKEEVKAEASTPSIPVIAKVEENKPKKPRAFPPIAPENLPPSYFVSASYDGRQKKAVIKLYEPESGQIYFWYDNTGHKPYCLTNLKRCNLEKIDRIVNHEGFNRLKFWKNLTP